MNIKSDVYKILFESILEGMFLVDSDSIIQHANIRGTNMFGYEKGELVGERLEILVPENFKEIYIEQRKIFHENPSKRLIESGLNLEAIRKDKSIFPVEVSLNHFVDEDEKEWVVTLITDISKRKKIQDELANLDENYRVLFDTIQEGLILVNKKGVIILANPKGLEMFGYNSEELLGQKIEKLIPDRLRAQHVAHRMGYHAHPVKRSMGQQMNLWGERKDGSVFPIEVSLNHFKNSKGEQVVAALASDITERKKVQDELYALNQTLEHKVEQRTKELWKSEQLYKSIARNFPSGVISIFNKELKYEFAEGHDLYKLGITTEDLVGQSYLDRLDEKTADYVEAQIRPVFKGDARSFEVMVKDQVYLLNAVPLEGVSGNIDRILVVEKNITEQKLISKTLEENLSKEKELSEMKSRFVSMASHEFRTPLTTINSSAGLIQRYIEKGDSEKSEKHIKRIKNSVRNLTSILNDFLSIEKLESGKIEVQLEEANLLSFFTNFIDEMKSVAKAGQTFHIECDEKCLFNTDLQILRNVLTNLVSNAIKYSPENAQIDLTSSLDIKGNMKISIVDRGIGIPKKDHDRMFGRFFRAANVTNIEGTGLGLTIVSRYVQLLQGEIKFESEEGKGSTFYVMLPKLEE